MSEHEIWKDVQGYEGFYQISNLGNLKSLERDVRNPQGTRKVYERVMKFTVRSGYYNVVLRKYGQRQSKQIHRLVAEAFIPNPQEFPIVNHKDFDRKNNRVENLEWCSQAQNVRWSRENMCKPKNVTYSSTGEKYIYKSHNRYRVCIKRFNIYKTFERFRDARVFRDEVIKNAKEYFGG